MDIEFSASRAPAYAAVVTLAGEHDLGSLELVEDALASVYGSILLDLSRCEFIDSSVLCAILDKGVRLDRDGQRLELLVPPDRANVNRVLEISGVRAVLTVHDALDGAPSRQAG